MDYRFITANTVATCTRIPMSKKASELVCSNEDAVEAVPNVKLGDMVDVLRSTVMQDRRGDA